MGAIVNFFKSYFPLFSFCFVTSGSGWVPSPSLSSKSSSLFFFLFFLCFVACGCKWAPSSILSRGGAQTPFILFYFIALGACGLHRQLLAEREPKLLFFFFCCLWVQVGAITKFWHKGSLLLLLIFVSSWVPSPSFGRRGVKKSLFLLSFVAFATPSPTFFFFFWLLLKHHH